MPVVLAATIIPQFAETAHDAKVSRAQTDIASLESALERLFLSLDRYPTTEEGLGILLTPPPDAGRRWRGPYIGELRFDPWEYQYQYRSPGQYGSRTYDLWSNGADGQVGGDEHNEDVVNWVTTSQ